MGAVVSALVGIFLTALAILVGAVADRETWCFFPIIIVAGLFFLSLAAILTAKMRKKRRGLKRMAELDAQIDVLSKEMEDTREKIRALRAAMDALIDQG